MKIYIVGSCDCESTDTRYACLTKATALKRWEEIRQELIERNKELLEEYSEDVVCLRIRDNLKETDPEKMDNYPQERPFIHEMETEE